MTPVILHLRSSFPDLPQMAESNSLLWSFDERIKLLGPDFYKKIVLNHPTLNMEYSILCHQIRHNFSFPNQIRQDQVIEQLQAALMLAELLEHVHLHYLVVPREVVRLRRHQHVYRTLLEEMTGMKFSLKNSIIEPRQPEFSLTQYIRDNTAQINWFRLLVTRTKRVLNFLDLVGTGSATYRNFVGLMDNYTNPFFAYLAWCFFIPRLTTNLFLIAKHTISWPDMDEKEKALDWYVRLQAQLQRRWFELGNDLVWVSVGLLNCFVLVGTLAPFSIYFTLFAFAFDIANASLRTYIELNRLYKLQDDYKKMFLATDDEESKKAIKEYQNYINHRIEFEKLRLGLSLAGTLAIFLAMCLAIPVLAVNPVLPFLGAVLLIAIWVATFVLTRNVEQYRPNDTVEKPSGVVQFGLFARKNNEQVKPILALDDSLVPSEDGQNLLSCG
ncbi:hypothetical protein [Legionella bononiensis]|uniref:Coiled-coil protein n=1 Tax=Legionella bononiensis TaxID=2793102 RepID=A0ABS1WDL2_9GAMM|nr:hypothetical protein [Legionella bononiensis]MBL7481419.1 hypothetical protein [Legionella bononiensis]MBL7527451.1 hypothetical protein [Legionella bononiensis]